MKDQSNTLFPIFLRADRLEILVVGGGEAGSEKVRFLMKNSPTAKLTVVAKNISDEIKEIGKNHPHIQLFERAFSADDLNQKKIAIIATDDAKQNKAIRDLAFLAGILTNVADTPDLCEFYLGSVVTRGDLKVAISTNGKSPTVAKRLRQIFEELLTDDLQHLLENLHQIRNRLTVDFQEKVKKLNK
ncbi:MAG: bifunctional precorrin-2 dehydrogenase/sirohydrochlorin ferrochelatase [Bacteroidota bacterium]